MTREDEFKNKSIKEKVSSTISMIVMLYLASVAYASIALIILRLLPSEYEMVFMVGTIVVLIVIAVVCVKMTLNRGNMLVKYIAEPVAELSGVAEQRGRADFRRKVRLQHCLSVRG